MCIRDSRTGVHRGGLDTHHMGQREAEEMIVHPAYLAQRLRQSGALFRSELGDGTPVRGGENEDLIEISCEKWDKHGKKAVTKKNSPTVNKFVFQQLTVETAPFFPIISLYGGTFKRYLFGEIAVAVDLAVRMMTPTASPRFSKIRVYLSFGSAERARNRSTHSLSLIHI